MNSRIVARLSAALLLSVLGAVGLHAQTYEPNWESLDARPTPDWYLDAKLGIFIH